ncbi:MAG TPA: class I SAM-dependent methyltransferase [Vicinamibacterales bacterium]|nr:class I SAM-dependent methyltransferase [Vicinamibacterales bacterium]
MSIVGIYDRWADSYPPCAHNPVMRAEQSVVEPILRSLAARRALDVGTGSGRYLPILRAGGGVVVGLDFSRAMLQRASGLRVCGDALALPFADASFDLVNASLMLGDIANLRTWAREIARVMHAGAHAVYSDFHPTWDRLGWKRTFETADGLTHELPIQSHTIDDHVDALASTGLRVLDVHEPRIGPDPDPAVERFRAKWGDPPVVAIFHATR